MFRFLNKYLISVLLTAVIFYFSTVTKQISFPPPFPHFDKLVHLLMYFALAVSLSMENSQAKSVGRYAATLVFPIVYGGLLEVLQELYFPPRTGDWCDWLADILGVILGCLLASRLRSVRFFRKLFRR